MNRSSDSDSQSSSFDGEGHRGGWGTMKFLMTGVRVSRRYRPIRGAGGFVPRRGARCIVIGTWSEPVEGREDSQLRTNSRRWGLSNTRSITKRWALPARGNLVYSPGGFRSAKPASAAFSK